jgi:hypothetical protein
VTLFLYSQIEQGDYHGMGAAMGVQAAASFGGPATPEHSSGFNIPETLS